MAGENIRQLSATNLNKFRGWQKIWESVQMLIECKPTLMEQSFSREVNEEIKRAWFVSNVDMARKYPGDTAMGAAYVRGTVVEQ